MSRENELLTVDDVLTKKFKPSKIGYNPIDVDRFLDSIILTIDSLNKNIQALKKINLENLEEINSLKKQLNDLDISFSIFKTKYKNIKESDFIDNKSNIELIKKVNLYEKKLSQLGIDIDSLK